MSFLAHSLVLASPQRAILSFCLSPKPRPLLSLWQKKLNKEKKLLSGHHLGKYDPTVFPLSHSQSQKSACVVGTVPTLAGIKKKRFFFLKQPRREKGMNNDCTCLPLSAVEPATCLFFISIAQFPPFPLSLPPFGQYLWNQTVCACQKITTSAAATGCQGSSPPDNLRAHWGNQKLSKVKCPLLWLS